MRLQGKVAVVTGAASGFGAGIARRFAALPRRYLDDVGMTFADLDAALPGMDASDPRNSPSTLAHSV